MPSRLTLHASEKGGIVAMGIGLLSLILIRLFGVEEGFWVSYTQGFRAAAWILLLTSAGWLALSALRNRTAFFELDRRLDADKFGLSLAAIALVTMIVLAVVIPKLPVTEEASLPNEPALRQQVLREENNLRQYVTAVVVLAGLSIAVFPTGRFLRK